MLDYVFWRDQGLDLTIVTHNDPYFLCCFCCSKMTAPWWHSCRADHAIQTGWILLVFPADANFFQLLSHEVLVSSYTSDPSLVVKFLQGVQKNSELMLCY